MAVNDLAPRGVLPSDAVIVSERLRSELVRGGVFRVMDRGQMDVILREQAFQQSGACDRSECAIQIGKLLSVDEMVVGTVGRIGSLYTLSAQLLDVGTGAIVLSVNQDFQGPIEELLSQSVPMIAAKLVAGKQGTQHDLALADLFLSSSPPGGRIEFDGVLRPETTPATLMGIAPGVHRVRVSTVSHLEEQDVALASGELRKVFLALKPGKGVLKIVTRPPGADARLDGRKLSETPFKLVVPAGEHVLELRSIGHVPVRESLTVRPDALVDRTVDLSPGQKVLLRSDYPAVRVEAVSGAATRQLVAGDPDTWLPYGAWVLRVRDPRFDPWNGSVSASVGSIVESRLNLVPKGAFADSIARAKRARVRSQGFGWVSFVGSIAAAGTAGYFHYDAWRAKERADAASAAYDRARFGDDMAGYKLAQNQSAKAANRSLVTAWILDGAAGALLTTAVFCWSF